MATWIKCTDTKQEPVYVNLDNAVTVTRNDAAEKVTERGTVISFMGGRFHSERALAVEREGKRLPPANLLLIAENSMAMAARYQP